MDEDDRNDVNIWEYLLAKSKSKSSSNAVYSVNRLAGNFSNINSSTDDNRQFNPDAKNCNISESHLISLIGDSDFTNVMEKCSARDYYYDDRHTEDFDIYSYEGSVVDYADYESSYDSDASETEAEINIRRSKEMFKMPDQYNLYISPDTEVQILNGNFISPPIPNNCKQLHIMKKKVPTISDCEFKQDLSYDYRDNRKVIALEKMSHKILMIVNNMTNLETITYEYFRDVFGNSLYCGRVKYVEFYKCYDFNTEAIIWSKTVEKLIIRECTYVTLNDGISYIPDIQLIQCSFVENYETLRYCDKLKIENSSITTVECFDHVKNLTLVNCYRLKSVECLKCVDILTISLCNLVEDYHLLGHHRFLGLYYIRKLTSVENFANVEWLRLGHCTLPDDLSYLSNVKVLAITNSLIKEKLVLKNTRILNLHESILPKGALAQNLTYLTTSQTEGLECTILSSEYVKISNDPYENKANIFRRIIADVKEKDPKIGKLCQIYKGSGINDWYTQVIDMVYKIVSGDLERYKSKKYL